MKKLFLLISFLLAFAFGEVGADESSTTPSVFVQTLPDYWEKCDFKESTIEGAPFHFLVRRCYDYIHGITNLRKVVTEIFEGKVVTTPTVVTYDIDEGHSGVQLSVLRDIVPDNVPIGRVWGRFVFFKNMDVIPTEGVIFTYGYTRAFGRSDIFQRDINERRVRNVASGNDKRKSPQQYIGPIMDDNNSFLIAAGWRITNLYDDCLENPNTCEPRLASYPEPYDHIGSSWCSNYLENQVKSSEICVLSVWTGIKPLPGSGGYSQGSLLGGGTSISVTTLAKVLWALASVLEHYYEWEGGITQKQATMMAVGIVKSCAIDLDEEGPDDRTGLGLLYVGCMEDGDGLVEDPKALIKDKYMFPNLYTFPDIMRTTQTIVTVSVTSSTEVVSVNSTTTNSVFDSDGVETRTILTTTVFEKTTTITTSTTIISPDGVQTTQEEQVSFVERWSVQRTSVRKICPKGKEDLCGIRIRTKIFLEANLTR